MGQVRWLMLQPACVISWTMPGRTSLVDYADHAMMHHRVPPCCRDEAMASISKAMFSDLPASTAAAGEASGFGAAARAELNNFLRLQLLSVKVGTRSTLGYVREGTLMVFSSTAELFVCQGTMTWAACQGTADGTRTQAHTDIFLMLVLPRSMPAWAMPSFGNTILTPGHILLILTGPIQGSQCRRGG